ncbi:MAG: alpha/beta hydrolase [Peptoniphilaceae bacterium]|nr:alpha/beta hydrolase [Peptoniphilaceae bacterium]MDD7383310.1 alpha/beta hydrolase [Peptoniphilaceae bacterium]MDY3738319.1 alpha/beta hydrolase [Peptoniphilaceae bacterium]
MKILTDIIYKDEDEKHKFDVYIPDIPNSKAIVLIHGGAFVTGDKSSDSDIATEITKNGYFCFVPNYRLAPKNIYPSQLDDMNSFMKYLIKSDFEFDKNKIGILGYSVGGNLAIELSLKYGYTICSRSGVIEFEEWLKEHKNTKEKEFTSLAGNSPDVSDDFDGSDDETYKWVLNTYLGNDNENIRKSSLLNRIDKNCGNMFLINSNREFIPKDGVIKLQNKLIELNKDVSVKFFKGPKHAKAYWKKAIVPTLNFFDNNL